MKIRTTTRAVPRAVALLGLLAGILVAVAPTASADEDVTVTWPTITSFNPDVYDYVVDIAYDGSGELVVSDPRNGIVMDGLDAGAQHVGFDADGRYRLQVELCTGGTCAIVSQSPPLRAYRSLSAGVDADWLGPQTTGIGHILPERTENFAPPPFDVAWQIEPYDASADDPGPAIESGTASQVADFPVVGTSDVLIPGDRYVYRAHVTVSGPEWGNLEADVARIFRWDPVAPHSVVEIGGASSVAGQTEVESGGVFFPVKDGRADKLPISLTSDEVVASNTYEVRTPAGDLVVAKKDRDGDRTWRTSWNGRDSRGALVPEGDYRVIAQATDRAGNVASVEIAISVSHKHLREKTFRRTYSPAATRIGQLVEKCGRLEKPARPAWPGSLGYLSQTPCSDPRQTTVATVHAVRLPARGLVRYESTQVGVTGGAATSAASYLALLYRLRSGHWAAPDFLDDAMGVHDGRVMKGGDAVVGIRDRKPTLIWEVGLGDGAKYDVKSFTVTVKYVIWR